MSNNRTGRGRRWLIIAAVVAVALMAFAWLRSGDDGSQGEWRTATAERGQVLVTIAATGTLRATSTVEIGSQISGQVLAVEADFNDEVERGQVIARLDPAPLQTRLTQARADLASARAGLTEAQAALVNARADHDRKRDLAERQLVARSELDLAVAARDQALARVGSARAVVEQRQAAVGAVELDLDFTLIRSPVDGVVLRREVEPGQTVAASLQTPLLFEIAEDLTRMQIELTVDESDVGQIRNGQPVAFTVDAFPDRRFRGQVRQVRLSATELNNVITYPVVVTVDNGDLSLLPGMTANAEIEVSRRDGALRVPNAALRFRPAGAADEGGPRFGLRPGELEALVETLEPDAAQRAVFEREAAAVRERTAQARRQFQQGGGGGGGPPPGAAGGGAMPSPEAIARMVEGRLREAYAEFRASLDEERRDRFDRGLSELLSARPGTIHRLAGGRPEPVAVRLGISDAGFTEVVSGGLAEGDRVITGQERPR